MYFWYFLVVIVFVMENHTNNPFTDNWTLRILRAPSTICVSEEAPLVVGSLGRDMLGVLKSGFNTKSKVTISRTEPYTVPRVCFYAVTSKQGISSTHAALRVISKWSSVAVFAFGTTLFASAQLMSISVVLMVLVLVLSAGVLGRVVAMWIASQIHRDNQPVLHAVVRERSEAAEFVQRIMDPRGLVIEISGHIVIDGKCVHRRSEWLNWARYFGLLAAPFDVSKIAFETNGPAAVVTTSKADNTDLEAGKQSALQIQSIPED